MDQWDNIKAWKAFDQRTKQRVILQPPSCYVPVLLRGLQTSLPSDKSIACAIVISFLPSGQKAAFIYSRERIRVWVMQQTNRKQTNGGNPPAHRMLSSASAQLPPSLQFVESCWCVTTITGDRRWREGWGTAAHLSLWSLTQCWFRGSWATAQGPRDG